MRGMTRCVQTSSLQNRNHDARLPNTLGRIMRGVWAGGLRLWCRPVSLRIFEKIRSQANRGRRRRNFEAECYATAVPALPCAISPYFISDGAFARALPGGQRSSPTRPNQAQLSNFARAVVFEPQSPYSPPVLIHLVAPLRTHLLDVEVTACRQGAQRGRRKSIRTPRGTKARRGRCRSGDPRRYDGVLRRARLRNWKWYAGPNVVPLGTPAFRVGRRVRISFAPAASHERTD
jgi:hypothetical protein